MNKNLKLWFLETRPHFLILSVVLVFLGTAIAWFYDSFNLFYALLTLFGLLLLHVSVNVLNDYFDYKSGIDLATRRTPFSGGSGFLPCGLLKPASVYRFGIFSFLLAVPIGLYFILIKGWLLLPLLLIGAFLVLFYTPYITKSGWPELAPGLGLGLLPVLGTYFVQRGEYTLPVLAAAIPSGILVHNLLFLNEFPDTDADRKGGRKTLPLILGKAKAAKFYTALTFLVYLWIIAGVMLKLLPLLSLIALLTLPFALQAVKGALNYDQENKLLPALGANVVVVLVTQFLLGIAYIGAGFI